MKQNQLRVFLVIMIFIFVTYFLGQVLYVHINDEDVKLGVWLEDKVCSIEILKLVIGFMIGLGISIGLLDNLLWIIIVYVNRHVDKKFDFRSNIVYKG